MCSRATTRANRSADTSCLQPEVDEPGQGIGAHDPGPISHDDEESQEGSARAPPNQAPA